MKTATNIHPDPKLLAGSANPVLIVVNNGKPLEHCLVSEHLPHCTIETIHERAETVTPLLKEILDKWPPEHWPVDSCDE